MTTETETPGGLEVAVEEREAWRRRLTITVPPARVAGARARELRKLGGALKLKGFRKGKVPAHVVEQRFGPLLEERTVQALVEEAYREALEERRLQPVGKPEFGDVRYDPGKSLTFQVELEILPEIRLQRVGGFRLPRPEVEVTDEQVEETLGRLREEHAVWQPMERLPQEGDLVSVRIARREGGEGAAEPRPYRFELGAGFAIPDVEKAIRTLMPGQEGEFDVSFPEEFDDPELAGASRRLRIELLDVKARRLPALDDEFASQVGDFDSLESLREAVREDLLRHAERETEETVRERLMDSIIEANPFEVPPSMVRRYLDTVLEVPEGADPQEVETARRSLRSAAERHLKRQMILDTLIEREGLEATDEELEARLRELAGRRGAEPAKLRRQLAREKRLESVRHRIAVEKAFQWLTSRSPAE